MSAELVPLRPLTGFDNMLARKYFRDNVNDVASGSNARFLGRQSLPPIDTSIEGGDNVDSPRPATD